MQERDLSPREAVQRFLDRRSQRATPATIRSYGSRLERFVEWCDDQEIGSMSSITAWEVDEYQAFLVGSDRAPATVKGHVVALKQLVEYCHSLGLVDEDTVDAIEIPKLTEDQESSDERLEAEEARNLLAFYRQSTRWRAHIWHAHLEVAWHTGARLGGIRSLDLGDFDADERTLEFRHRPDTATQLKNKSDGERIVGIGPEVAAVLEEYIARERPRKRDRFGREPLFSGRQGRPSESTFRSWAYLGTQPCLYRDCPHGTTRACCEFPTRNHASKCPSSRSPHAIRTGSITWQLGKMEIDQVASRVNAAPSTIRRYYDVASIREEFEDRRREIGTNLDIDENDTENLS